MKLSLTLVTAVALALFSSRATVASTMLGALSLRLFRFTVMRRRIAQRAVARLHGQGKARRGFEVQRRAGRHGDGPRRRVDRKGPARVARRNAVGDRLAVPIEVGPGEAVAHVRHRRGVGAVLVEGHGRVHDVGGVVVEVVQVDRDRRGIAQGPVARLHGQGKARRGFEVQRRAGRHGDGPRRRVDRKGPARVARRDAVGDRLAVPIEVGPGEAVAHVRHRRGVRAVLVEGHGRVHDGGGVVVEVVQVHRDGGGIAQGPVAGLHGQGKARRGFEVQCRASSPR